MYKASIFLFFSVAIIIDTFGQYNSYLKYKYEWNHEFPTGTTVSSEFQHKDIVIFEEKLDYHVDGTKPGYLKIYVKKYEHFKYLNKEGIKDYSVFTLPESFDPTFDKKDLPLNKKDSKHRPRIFDVKVAYFACRILKKDGEVVNAVIEDEMLTDRKMFDLTFYSAYSYQFRIMNVEEGDEVELEYKYEIPYDQNWYLYNSVRVFFHGKYPKQQYQFSFDYKKKLGTTFLYHNGCKPTSIIKEDEKVKYVFKHTNLPGCINELNGRPHKELPFFVFDLAPRDLRFYYRRSGFLESSPLPFWLYILKIREQYTLWEVRRSDPLIHDKQYLKFQKFIAVNTTEIDRNRPFLKFIKLHNLIVEKFEYQKDGPYFAGLDTRLERLGDFTENHKLREISRFKLYARMLNTLKLPYHSIYVMDKRIAEMGRNYISPIIDNEYLFSLPINDGLYYVYSKQNRYGYYGDELPFYWEGSPALFIRFGNLWGEKLADLTFITTPTSEENDNIRNSNVKVNVDLRSGEVSFEAKTSLAGQFSTMTRSVYDYGLMDSTLNQTYGKKIDDIGNGVVSSGSKRKSRSTKFPYKVNYVTKYTSDNLITTKNDSVFQIDMNNWFHHIIEEKLHKGNRELSYYPDFRFQDVFKYYLVFEENMTLTNLINEVNITNSFGSYRVSLNQLNPRTILVESHFTVSTDKVEALHIEDVLTINEAIINLNNSSLEVKSLK